MGLIHLKSYRLVDYIHLEGTVSQTFDIAIGLIFNFMLTKREDVFFSCIN